MPRLEDFLGDVARSRLVSSADLDRASRETPPDDDAATALARELVKRKHLTSYQARKLLAGATRGFFLGGYRILRPLGEGGMGKVYLAQRDADGQRVAIKVLPPKLAQEEERTLARFLREVELSQRVIHPNLARTIEAGVDGDVHFMVLEYIPGQTLYDAVKGEKGGPLRVPDAVRLFVKVLDGLAAAHDAGLVHRDVKPSNIMITPEGEAKVLDLGLARAVEEDKPLTRPNMVVGTLDYASPEQLTDAHRADARSDLYSVGCTLYFALAGRPPFEGGDLVNKMFKQRMEDPDPLEQVAKGVPPAFAAIVRKLMNKQPQERYQSAEELKRDLLRWTDLEKVRALMGAAAEAAPPLRPAPPVLDEDDLRLLPAESTSLPGLSLRDLGEAEPAAPPRPRPAAVAVPARAIPARQRRGSGESRWLAHFIAAVVVLGLLLILLLTIFF